MQIETRVAKGTSKKSPQTSVNPAVSSRVSLNKCRNKAARFEPTTFWTVISSLVTPFMLHRLLY